MSDVTRILSQVESGDPQAAEKLLPLVYDELRQLAEARLAQERPGQTLQATALVHEAYLRLVGRMDGGKERQSDGGAEPPLPSSFSPSLRPSAPAFDSCGHFFAAAAEAMRRILIERARQRNALKRGGDIQREPLSDSAAIMWPPPDELLAVHDALDRLAEIDPAAATLVKLRYFVGLNMSEVAHAMGISVRSAHEIWAYARTWLHQNIAAD
jgi:DNA-directed RNA polymerase specialized sigma24 family protein